MHNLDFQFYKFLNFLKQNKIEINEINADFIKILLQLFLKNLNVIFNNNTNILSNNQIQLKKEYYKKSILYSIFRSDSVITIEAFTFLNREELNLKIGCSYIRLYGCCIPLNYFIDEYIELDVKIKKYNIEIDLQKIIINIDY